MSNFYNRNRNQDRRQNSGGGNYNRNSYQQQESIGRQPMVNPWQDPVAQLMAGGGAVLQTNTNEATMAFNILNQVLSTDTASSPMSSRLQSGRRDFQNRESGNVRNRIEDRRRKSPQFSNRNNQDSGSRQWSSRSRSPHRAGSSSSRRDGSNKRNMADRLGRDNSQRRDSKSSKSKSKDRDHDSSKSGEEKGSRKSQDTDKKDPVKEKENEEQIIKCLKCHICEIDSFDSIESFRNHKKSEDHRLLASIFNARSEAVLQVLRADAKWSACREKEKSGNANKETSSDRCVRCNIDVADAFKSHKKSIEHELVDNYMSRECCGSTFAKRKDFEEHRLTIPHLKRYVEPPKDDDSGKKAVLAHTDEEELASTTLRELKDAHQFKLDSPADFPEYNPTELTGLSYIHKKRRFTCTVCKKSFPSYNTMALAHCRSFNHYLMLMAHLEPQIKEVEDEEETPETEEPTETESKDENDSEEIAEEREPKEETDQKEDKQDGDDLDNDEELVAVKEENEGDEVGGDKEVKNKNDIIDGDEEMGETMPVLEDEGIILEESDKFGEEIDGDNNREDFENEMEGVNDDNFADNTDEKEQEEKSEDEVKEDEDTEDVKSESPTIEEQEEDEEIEEEPEPEVKPKTPRGRRGRGRGRTPNLRRY